MVIIKNAIENIKTNKIRVIVAMVWIVLGITSVVVVSSIGNGIEQQGINSSKDPAFRTTNIYFSPNYESSFDPTFYEPFTLEDIGKLSGIRGVEKITPKYGEAASGMYGKNIEYEDGSSYSEIIEYKDNKNIEVQYGRSFSLDDLDRNTIILDGGIAYGVGIYTPRNAVGKNIEIDGETFEVVGVLESDVAVVTDGFETPKSYMPKKALQNLEEKNSFGGPLNGLELLVKPGYDVSEVGSEVTEKLSLGKDKSVGTYEMNGGSDGSFQLGILQSTINRFTSILSNVSLAIGGIGIMNIMYMSVTERKREIGIRRAIGAEPKDIVIQFLIETIVITIMGGLVGIVVGSIAASQVGPYLGVEAIPSAQVYAKALFISIMTGAIFGAIPAIKASKLDPIQAIQG
ncbi:MAG: ABC transporter permease [Peptostreptococcaceae bacterium]